MIITSGLVDIEGCDPIHIKGIRATAPSTASSSYTRLYNMTVDSTKAVEAKSAAMEPPPPSYASATENEKPPAYTAPSSYRIGGQMLTSPLVTVPQLKAHLSLLRAFKQLRTVIDEGKDPRLPEFTRSMDALPRWAWFVGLAVER